MSIQLGSQQFAGAKFEAVRNTAELVPNIIFKLTENSLKLEKQNVADKIIMGNRDNTYNNRFTSKSVSGKIMGSINTKDIGFLLKMAMAQPTSSTALGATTHTFKPLNLTSGAANVKLPSFTFFWSDGAYGYYKANGCVIDTLSLTIGETETTFEAEIKGLNLVEVTNGTEKTNILSAITYSAPDPYLNFGNVVVKFASTFAGLSAGTVLNVKPDIKIDIKNNVEFDKSSSSAPYAEATNFDTLAKGFEASVELSFYDKTENKGLYDGFLSSVDSSNVEAFEIKLENQSYGVLGTSTLFNSLTFQIPQALPVLEITRPIDGFIEVNLKMENLVNTPAQGFSIQSILTNTTATY